MAKHLSVDVIAIGTVGRSGIKGLLLGNTAEAADHVRLQYSDGEARGVCISRRHAAWPLRPPPESENAT